MPVGLGHRRLGQFGRTLAREAWLSGVLGKGVEKKKEGSCLGWGARTGGRHKSRESLVFHLKGEGHGGQRSLPQPHSEPRQAQLLA